VARRWTVRSTFGGILCPRARNASSRLKKVVYLLEGLVFLVTGLQIRTLLDRMDTILLGGPLLAVLLTVAVVIVARFVWVYPAIYLPRRLSPALARRDPLPPWQWAFFLAFVGVRGVVSLAAALAIPLTTQVGTPFPYRDLILFVTLGVFVVTVVGQGLPLPGIVRWLGLGSQAADEREHTAELAARVEALSVVQDRLDQLAADGRIAPEVLAILRARHDYRVGRLPRNASNGAETASAAAELRSELIAAEREYIYQLFARGQNYRRGTPTHRARARPGGGEHRTQERGRSGTSSVGFGEGGY
jgi:NhaP-type Na+/H+ or K+/H+ antiporter